MININENQDIVNKLNDLDFWLKKKILNIIL